MTQNTSKFFDTLGTCYQIDPVSIRHIFLYLVRNHYSNADHYGDVPDVFKRFVYSDNVNRSQVRIEMDYEYNEEALIYPAIFVGVGDIVFSGARVMDNYSGHNSDNSGVQSAKQAQTRLSFRHIARKPEDALQMGVITNSFFSGMRKKLISTLNLMNFEPVNLAQPQLIKKDDNPLYRVDSTFNIFFSDEWITTTESARVKNVAFAVKPSEKSD